MKCWANWMVSLSFRSVSTPPCVLGGLGLKGHHQRLDVIWSPGLCSPSLELFETLDILITGGRTRLVVPGALKTGRKHLLWGRPDIPGHRQVHLLVPFPTFPSAQLLAAYFLRGPSTCPQAPTVPKMPFLVGTGFWGVGAGLSLAPCLGVFSYWGGDVPQSLERCTYRLGQQPPTPPPTPKYI